MRNWITIGVALMILTVFASCHPERKTADYYNKNQQTITEIRNYYDELYNQQPFSIGFTDRSFKYYVVQIVTDTLRSIYNTEQSERQLFDAISKFNYDTAAMYKMAAKMKEIKCIWLDKNSFYLNYKKETVTYLSFKSVAGEKPFQENKYYVLIFLQHPINHPVIKNGLKKGQIVKIDDLVYYGIANKFR